MNPGEIIFVNSPSGDWVAVYRNDILIHEGHSVTGPQILDALGIAYESRETTEQYAEAGSWDRRFSEIPQEALQP